MRQLFVFPLFLFSIGISAQHFCYTTEAQNEWFKQHPDLKAKFEQQQKELADIDKVMFQNGYKLQGKSAAAPTVTIPVVFHILHTGGNENISDAQVIDAVKILNEDFNKLNADTNNVVVQFKNLIGDAQIAFQLATKDPFGNATNGILRHWSSNTDWKNNTFSDYVYSWPSNRYMNVYVVRSMGGGAAGYTYLPGSGVPMSADAIVILSTYVGSIGTGNSGTSRALTHEVGHWLNLPHTWGGTNQPGVACGDDGVNDTPVTKGFTSCNLTGAAVCNPGVVENVQNYMDYAYCQRMFTLGQVARMQLAINSATNGRNNLSTPSNLAFTGVINPALNPAPLQDIGALPSVTVCSGQTLSLTSYTYNAAPTSYLWSADNGAIIANPGAQTTNITFSNPGITNVSCQISNSNGVNTKNINITVGDGIAEVNESYSQGFEFDNDIPTDWKVINPTTPSQKWEIIQGIGSEGAQSAYIPGEIMSPNSIEILESPSYDFKNNQGAQFTFKYAYAKYSNANKDVFKVQATRNCGASWIDVWTPSNTFLASGSGGITNDLYIIPQESEWKTCNVTTLPNFQLFRNESNVRLRFFFQEDVGGTGYGNRFYLDEIVFTGPVGVNELTRSIGFNVYPNPSNGAITIGFHLSDKSEIKYSVTSVTGALLQTGGSSFSAGEAEIRLNENHSLTPGIYFVNLEMNGVKMSQKIVISE